MFQIKSLAAQLPEHWQTELKRLQFSYQIKRQTFLTHEPEYKILHSLINPGDWVLDIGANIGHYTQRLSEIVGDKGRVIAFEPVPTTFALLASNVECFKHKNVTLINAAVSNEMALLGMAIPKFKTGLKNYYQAHLTELNDSSTAIAECKDENLKLLKVATSDITHAHKPAPLSVLTLSIDSLGLNNPVALIKIDTEGHEEIVLKGLEKLINRDRPILIVETSSEKIIHQLHLLGYIHQRLKGSPNILFTQPNATQRLHH